MSRKFSHQLTYTKFPQSLYHGDKIRFVNETLARLGKGQRILDVGCGAVPYISPGNQVYPLDADEEIVKALQVSGKQAYLGDANNHIPFDDEHFDAALLLDVIEHFYQPDKAVSEIRRVLKPGGVVLIFTPNFGSLLWHMVETIYFPLACRYHKERYSEHVFNNKPEALKTFLEKFFVVEQLRLCSYGMAVFCVCKKK